MSLDVSLYLDGEQKETAGSGIFVRENGSNREISRAEWDEKFPGTEPVLAQSGDEDEAEVWTANITHNLGKMAKEAGLYECLWYPATVNIQYANQLVLPIRAGLERLQAMPEFFRQWDNPNDWGTLDQFIDFLRDYLRACQQYPNARVRVSR